MQIKEISETAEVGLNNVDSVGITEDLKSHSQPLSNEEIYDLAQQLTELHTRPTQRLSRPPLIQKIGAENHMLQLKV